MAQKLIKSKSRTKARYDNSRGLSNTVKAIENSVIRSDLPEFAPGDTIKVHVKIKEGEKERLQAFEGTVIKIGNHGAGRSFIVRKISHGVGVERIFNASSPSIGKIDVVTRGKVRRSKLYYIRELEGKAAKIDREIVTNESAAASAAAKSKAN
ncbi:MAG: 50S ribosomal protein L19 [Bdellovibrionales bacterium]|nr:50S ribosomal protein L19 [Bdellovibrionales bacterium]